MIFITGRIAAYYAAAFRQCGGLDVYEIHSRMSLSRELLYESYIIYHTAIVYTVYVYLAQ